MGSYTQQQLLLAKIDQEKIKTFLATNLVPNRSHLYISGVFEQEKLSTVISNVFASWQFGEAKKIGPVLSQQGPKITFIDRENAPQSTVRLGLAVIDPKHKDYLKVTMMNTLLGGAFSSRITSNIREDKGYTYSPYSTVVNRVNSGLWYQAADITSESTGVALVEIFKEIQTLSSG